MFDDFCTDEEVLLNKVNFMNKLANKSNCVNVDVELVKKGIDFAKFYHRNQTRKSGEPYYTHPIAVASIAMQDRFTDDIICGALLHDVVEDSECTCDIIAKEFSFRIAEIVHRITRYRFGQKMSVKYLIDKMILEKDNDAIIVKVADRIHNILTCSALTPEKQEAFIQETILNIYPCIIMTENILRVNKMTNNFFNINIYEDTEYDLPKINYTL